MKTGNCMECTAATTQRIDVWIEDPYGMACSEEWVPDQMQVKEFVCEACHQPEEPTP